MKKIYFLFIILISTASFGQNLATNGGFENWTSGVPDSWPTVDFNTTDLTQDMTTFNEGSSSAKVNVLTQSQASTDIRQNVSLTNGAIYTVSLDVYATDNQAKARLFGPGFSPAVYSDDTVLNTWQTITLDYTATADGDAEFGIRFYDTSGNWLGTGSLFYIDNFQVVEKTTPSITITSPSDNERFDSSTSTVQVVIGVNNFTFSDDAGGGVSDNSGDGYIKRTLVSPGGTFNENLFNADPADISVAAGEAFTVTVEIVDNAGASFAPVISETVSFSIDNPPVTLPMYDGFDYTTSDNLRDQANWYGVNSGDEMVVSTGSLSYTGLVASVGNSIDFAGTGMDSQLNFTPVTSGTVFASFIFKVTDQTAITDLTDGGYFAYFSKPGSFSFKSRVWAHSNPDAAGSTFDIGYGSGSSSPTATPSTYNVGDDVFVVVSYELTTGLAKIWVNPADTDLGAGTAPAETFSEVDPGTAETELSQFNLRQDSDEETPAITFDELRIGTTWADVTPTTTASIGKSEIDGFAIYPNPVSNGEFSIRTRNGVSKSVQIFDMLGKQVYSKEVQANENVKISNLNMGIYILKVQEEGILATRKLVVQ